MKPVTLTVTLDADALFALFTQAIERGTARCTQVFEKGVEQRATEKVAPTPVIAFNEPQAQTRTVE